MTFWKSRSLLFSPNTVFFDGTNKNHLGSILLVHSKSWQRDSKEIQIELNKSKKLQGSADKIGFNIKIEWL